MIKIFLIGLLLILMLISVVGAEAVEKKKDTFLLSKTDPEFAAFFEDFAFEEVPGEAAAKLDPKRRGIVITASLIGCQGKETFAALLPELLDDGLTPAEANEVLYQSVAYCGIGRVLPFFAVVRELLTTRGELLPLPPLSTASRTNRLQKGIQAQVDIFGPQMSEFYNSGPQESRHINRWLAANCFGDYYTRGALDYRERELATFCYIAAQGGCEPQLLAHAAANLKNGNDKALLIAAVSQSIPYIGYPRALNALRCVNEAAAQLEAAETKGKKE